MASGAKRRVAPSRESLCKNLSRSVHTAVVDRRDGQPLVQSRCDTAVAKRHDLEVVCRRNGKARFLLGSRRLFIICLLRMISGTGLFH